MSKQLPQPGDLVRISHRDSRRHKWLVDHALVILLDMDDESVLIVGANYGEEHRAPCGDVMSTGATSMNLQGVGSWERKVELVVHMAPGQRRKILRCTGHKLWA